MKCFHHSSQSKSYFQVPTYDSAAECISSWTFDEDACCTRIHICSCGKTEEEIALCLSANLNMEINNSCVPFPASSAPLNNLSLKPVFEARLVISGIVDVRHR